MNIVWIGCHSEGTLAFEEILKKGKKVTKFITLSDQAFEKRSSASRKYIELCDRYDVPVEYVSTIKSDEAYDIVKSGCPDLLFVIGWSEIIPEKILNLASIGTVGTHASLLPHNRGSAPVNWAIIKGEKTTGNSMMWLDKNVDEGNIIDQIPIEILPYDTCKTIYEKVAVTNRTMLSRLVDRLEKGESTVMDLPNVTDEEILPRRRPKDGLINWNAPANQVYDFIRALVKPYPGAFTYLGEKKFLFWEATIISDNNVYDCPGEILCNVYSTLPCCCGIQVACAKGSILIHCIEDESGINFQGQVLADLNLKGKFGSICE